jgi:ABC-type nitrate/sulfonate/bicarbonate transport system permease component
LGLAILVGLWALIASQTTALQLPSPGAVLSSIRRDFTNIPGFSVIDFRPASIVGDLPYTVIGVAVGVGVGVLAGLAIGLLVARVRVARDLLQLPLVALGTIPVVVLLPFITIWFGTARLAQSGVVIFFTLVTIAFIAQEAAASVADGYENFARSLGASDRRILTEVIFPAVMPEVVGGIRVALAAGWGLECAAELLGGQHGAGLLITIFANQQATSDIFGVLVCVGVVALLCDAGIACAGRWVVRWKE